MIHAADNQVAFIELRIKPSVELISVVREFVSEFYARVFPNPDVTARVALATHELLENAVRYSNDGETRLRIEVTKGAPVASVIVRTWNRPEARHLDTVHKMFAEMKAEPDPFRHYQALMHRNAKRVDGSGLGLARIQFEAEMNLNYEIGDGVLCIEAQAEVQVNP